MLPNGRRDKATAIQIMLYCTWTVVASLVPVLGITGDLFLSPIAGVLTGVIGAGLIYYAFRLFRERSSQAARALMLASVSYITLLQIIYVVDKFIR